MGLFNNFPYIDLSNLNLDFILRELKNLITYRDEAKEYAENSQASADDAAQSATAADNARQQAALARNAAEQFATNAQTSARNAKMYADNIADPVSGIVTGWLADHITNPSNPPLNTSLTVAGSAADAKAAGDRIRFLESAFDITQHVSENLLNPATIELGCYYWTDGRHESAGYNSSALIPVVEGETYYFQNGNATVAQGRNMQNPRFITAYDAGGNVVAGESVQQAYSFTVASGVAYIRISSGSTILTATNFYMVSTYDHVVDYIAYYDPYTTIKLKNDADSLKTDQNTEDLQDLSDTVDQNSQDIAELKAETLGGKIPLVFRASEASLAANSNLTVCEHSDNKKNEYIELTAKFSTFGNLTIAHGEGSYEGGYIVITPTKIEVYHYNGTLLEEFTHSLAITSFINAIIYTKNDQSCRSSITLMTAGGEYTVQTSRFYSSRASVLCRADFAMTDVQMSYAVNDALEDVWIFGDSYVSIGDPARWAYQMITSGHTKAMICGYGGAKASDEILPFREFMAVAKPRYVVWTLGMNDADSSSAINASWKTYTDEVIATCEADGVTVILATIPNTPGINNTFKNAYVRSSGKRYVDFAKAVNAESAGATWYPGMLDSDNTHPTSLGAKALMRQFILDVPEVLAAEI